jgi:eukaryotic-like serine/threonine-protein kinase
MHQLVEEFEWLIASQIVHPGFAAPIATGTDGITVHLVREFVAADSLDIAVREHGPAPPAAALRVAAQLAGALDAAASVNVLHGALHPRDVLIAADEARMTDLGVCALLQKVGVSVPVRRPYTAPERIGGTSWDRRADVYSLSALVFELLWGRRPAAMGAEAVEGLSSLPGGDTAALASVFARGLAAERAGRFDTAGEFAAALRGAFPGVVVESAAADFAEADTTIKAVGAVQLADAASTPEACEPRLPLEDPQEVSGDSAHTELREPEAPAYTEVEETPVAAAAIEAETAVADLPRRPLLGLAAAAATLVAAMGLAFGGGYFVGSQRFPAVTVPSATAAPPTEDLAAAARPTPAPAPPTKSEIVPPLNADAAPAPGPTNRRATGTRRATPATPAASTGGSRPVARPRVAAAKERASAGPAASTAAVPFAGVLVVESRPPGADVFVDGKPAGITPVVLARVDAGEHAVRLEREGYRRWSASVRIVSGERNRVTASLER